MSMEVEMLTVGSFAVNCYLLYEQKSREAVFIDPGAEAGWLIQRAGELNLQVKSIVNTHGHIDHAAEAALVQQHFDIPFFIHAEEEPLINSLPEQGSLFGISVEGKPKINMYLSANDEIKIGDVSGWVIHTPGHSPGGISLVFDKKVFVGDCLFMDSIGRTITQTRILKATVLLSEDKKSLEARHLELDAIARLNKAQYIAGGSFGFHLFYCFYPYAMDAIHIKQAIDQLKRHDRENATMNLEMVYAMRAAGRHMSKSAYELYIKHLWANPGGWAIKMQKYIDVWDQWHALRYGEKEDELSALPDLFKKAIALLNREVENLKPIVDKIQSDFSRL